MKLTMKPVVYTADGEVVVSVCGDFNSSQVSFCVRLPV